MTTPKLDPMVTVAAVRRMVELACLAPSVHNTQPWRWRVIPDGAELYGDPTRQLTLADPDGRELVMSCGATLHYAQVAARALGWDCVVERLAQRDSTLLARLHLDLDREGQASPQAVEQLQARCTDRRRFTSWPVPNGHLERLAAEARRWGVHATPLVDERFTVERLVARASDLQSGNERVREEERAWVDRSAVDGVPSTVLPTAPDTAGYPSRLGFGSLEESLTEDVDSGEGLILLYAAHDEPLSRLRAGEALSALWLAAGAAGLSVVPLSQVIEVAETRGDLRERVLDGLGVPLILVRVGWQPISRGPLPRTPRRPVDDVLAT